jgi:hypothetical protein
MTLIHLLVIIHSILYKVNGAPDRKVNGAPDRKVLLGYFVKSNKTKKTMVK